MKQIRWFDRKFNFSKEENIFPAIVERLRGTPVLLYHKILTIPREKLTIRLNDDWSIQEHIGHLLDLEPLWLGRLDDVLNGVETMRPADLKNTKTHEAKHNQSKAGDLAATFTLQRNALIEHLEQLSEKEVFSYSLHPRLKKPMRIMDLFLFVAEHDDHHLAKMTEIDRLLNDV